MVGAFELVDWLRIVNHSLCPPDVGKLATVISRFYPLAVNALLENLHPGHALSWQGINIFSQFAELRKQCVQYNVNLSTILTPIDQPNV
jgi:hypothetical protein